MRGSLGRRAIQTSVALGLSLSVGSACRSTPSTPTSGTPVTVPPVDTAPAPAALWRLVATPGFSIANGQTPNAGWVNGEVWLTVSHPGEGLRLYRSADGLASGAGGFIAGLSSSLEGTGYAPTETVPRQGSAGRVDYYVLGLGPPNSNRAVVFRLQDTGRGVTRAPAVAVYEGLGFIGVPDVYPTPDGRLRLVYVEKNIPSQTARTAVSNDGGARFDLESSEPFGDAGAMTAADRNVDPAVVRLAGGGYVALTMRERRLYLFTSQDGASFTPQAGVVAEGATFRPGAQGLYDPTLVQLPGGEVVVFVTLQGSTGETSIVRGTLLPP